MRKHFKIAAIITLVVLVLVALSASIVFAADTTPGNNVCQGANCQGECDGNCNGQCTGDCDGTCDGNCANNGACLGKCNGQAGNTATACTGNCGSGQNGFGRRGR